MAKRKKPPFRCSSEAQKRAIRRYYAEKSQEGKARSAQEKLPFKLPLKNGGRIWNIYRVPNYILNGKQDGDVHGGLVLDELNDNVMLVEVTHSAKKGKRNNLPVRNLVSTDVLKDGKFRDSYIVKDLVVSVGKNEKMRGVDVSALKNKINDSDFSIDEKQRILDELSHLSTAEERYQLFEKLAKEKADL